MPAAKKKSSGKSSRSTSRKAAATRAAKREAAARAREMWGVAFASTGILLGIYMFISKQGLLGEWFSQFLFGVFGTLCYCLPILLIWCAYVNIFSDEHPDLRGSETCLILGIGSVMVLLQVIHTDLYAGVRYLDYLRNAYRISYESHVGGGFAGALFAYPILLLGGKALGYILPIAGILLTCMLVFRLSIRRTAKRVSSGVSSTAARIRDDYEENMEILAQRAEERRARRAEKLHVYSLPKDSPDAAGSHSPEEPAVSEQNARPSRATDGTESGRRKKKEPETLAEIMDKMLEGLPASEPKPASERRKHTIADTGENITTYPAPFKDGVAGAIPGREDPIPETQYWRSVKPDGPEEPAPAETAAAVPDAFDPEEEPADAVQDPPEAGPGKASDPSGKRADPSTDPQVPAEDTYAPPPLSLLPLSDHRISPRVTGLRFTCVLCLLQDDTWIPHTRCVG